MDDLHVIATFAVVIGGIMLLLYGVELIERALRYAFPSTSRWLFGGMAPLHVLAALALAYQGWRFLTMQELRHQQPTPEMTFVFTVTSVFPLAMSVFLLILLAEM